MYISLALLAATVFPLWVIKKGIELKNPPYAVVLVGLIYSVGGALLIFGGASVMGVDVSGEAAVNEVVKFADVSKDQAAQLTEYYSNAYMLLPTFFFIWGAIISYLEYRIIVSRKRKKGFDAISMIPVEDFSMPRNAGLSWILLYLVASIMLSMDATYAKMIYSNVFALMQFAFAYQGISFICNLLIKKKISKTLGIVLCVLLMLSGKGIYALFILGFTDLCFGLKGRVKEKK